MTENIPEEIVPPPRPRWVRWLRRKFEANDTRIFLLVNNRLHNEDVNWALRTLSHAFNGGWAYIIGVAVFLPFRRKRAWGILERNAVPIWASSLLVEGPLKAIFRRRRPFHKVVEVVVIGTKPSNWSFPSGHAATAFAGAHLLAREVPSLRWFLYGIAAVVAGSRVYLGVHYPSDVVIGSTVGVLLSRFFSWWWEHILPRFKNDR
jgi:undecaprenyl-diphosphatase